MGANTRFRYIGKPRKTKASILDTSLYLSHASVLPMWNNFVLIVFCNGKFCWNFCMCIAMSSKQFRPLVCFYIFPVHFAVFLLIVVDTSLKQMTRVLNLWSATNQWIRNTYRQSTSFDLRQLWEDKKVLIIWAKKRIVTYMHELESLSARHTWTSSSTLFCLFCMFTTIS